MAKKNAFDAIAKPAAPKKASSTKIAATVTDEIKTSVDFVLANKAEIKRLEADMETHTDKIRNHVFKQQATHARAGNYSNSFSVQGNNGEATYTASDRWTLPKETEVQDNLKEFLGDKFEEWFETKRTITLNEKVSADAGLVAKIQKVIEGAGVPFSEAFTVVDTLKTKKDLDVNQFELNDEKLARFRTFCKQYKAGVK